VLAIPGFVGSALDPLIGVIGDTARRRLVMVVGGLAFAASAALSAAAGGFGLLLAALVLGNPATGAFVSLAQATLMDADPLRRVRNMARWTLAGSFGYVGGPLLLVFAVYLGVGWRGAIAALAVAALPLTFAALRFPEPRPETAPPLGRALRAALAAIRRREVLRLLLTLEAADLLLDIFHGFLALYLVDAAGRTQSVAALGVAVWTGAGLVGDWLLLPVLSRMSGARVIRVTALLSLGAYPASSTRAGMRSPRRGSTTRCRTGVERPSPSADSAGSPARLFRSRSASSPAPPGSPPPCGCCCWRRSPCWR
jgi:FSR family fosmidomycin resistance protein-like MFS transporter